MRCARVATSSVLGARAHILVHDGGSAEVTRVEGQLLAEEYQSAFPPYLFILYLYLYLHLYVFSALLLSPSLRYLTFYRDKGSATPLPSATMGVEIDGSTT